MTGGITRRGFIGAAAAGATLATAASPAFAISGPGAGLFLFDPSLTPDAWVLLDRRTDGADAVALKQDLVRHWREGLGSSVTSAGSATAVVRWAEACILAGLAREYGGTATMHPLGTGAFEVHIAGNLSVPTP
jgi:hypothetical protein